MTTIFNLVRLWLDNIIKELQMVVLKRRLAGMSGQIQGLCWKHGGSQLAPKVAAQVAEQAQGVIAGVLDLTDSLGLSEVGGLNLFGPVVSEGKLTKIEIVRQMLGTSKDPEAFADALRKLADQIEKNPGDFGAGVSLV